MAVEILEANDRLDELRALFLEYQEGLSVDLCFQGFQDELRTLPGRYARPAGRLYLALADGECAGCAALRAIDLARCEMKRMYVRPAYRGLKLGRALAERVVADARAIGYREMLLDTLASMVSAQALYEHLGFRDVPPYCYNPLDGARYMALKL